MKTNSSKETNVPEVLNVEQVGDCVGIWKPVFFCHTQYHEFSLFNYAIIIMLNYEYVLQL